MGERAPPLLLQSKFAADMLGPSNALVGWLGPLFSRRKEYQADEFSYKLNSENGPLLKSALKKSMTDNLSFPIHDSWYAWRHHSHPSVIERCETIDKMMAEEGKKDK